MRICFYFLLLFATNAVFSQSSSVLSDKEFLNLQDKTRVLMSSNRDSALVLSDRIEKSNNYSHKAFSAAAKSYLFQLKNDTIKSNQFYKLALQHLSKVPPSNQKKQINALLLNFGGLIDWGRGNLAQALDKYHQGKKISESINDQIQVIKFNNNIALINSEVGNYKLAISTTMQSDKMTDRISNLYTKEKFMVSKSNVYLNLGSFYELYYKKEHNPKLLDSALLFYTKAVTYSKNLFDNKIKAQMSLGNIYYLKNDFTNAEKTYQNVLMETTKNDYPGDYWDIVYNLGDTNYNLKQYSKALVYFKKSDSIYAITKSNHFGYVNSNYYQAKIYEILNDKDRALQHAKIYLDNFEKNEFKLNKETTEVNFRLSKADVKSEMIDIQKKFKNEVLFKNVLFAIGLLLIVFLAFFLIKNIKEKKQINKKVNALIVELSEKIENKDVAHNEIPTEINTENETDGNTTKKGIVAISIDEEKENEIVEKLNVLEKKLQYLNPDFTQQIVAKKIKTNTTYLSYVVNKRFGKTFSEYSNELKINYALNEMISNPTYRKYSTQAIAESVGFKNAVSFTKSFNKRTGVTPAQFIKGLEKAFDN